VIPRRRFFPIWSSQTAWVAVVDAVTDPPRALVYRIDGDDRGPPVSPKPRALAGPIAAVDRTGAIYVRLRHGIQVYRDGRRAERLALTSIGAINHDATLFASGYANELIFCAQTSEDCKPYLAKPYLPVPITVPPLASRPDDLDQIITEYAEDAITELGTARTGFLPADREWVRMHSALSLPDIEKATLRLVAIRESRNLSTAASRLGMAPVSLKRWIERRKLPMNVEL